MVENGPNAFKGIYHKLQSVKNGHYQWESRFAGHRLVRKIWFDSSISNTWVITAGNETLVLSGLENFFEPLTVLAPVSFRNSSYTVKLYCHDSKHPTTRPTQSPTLTPTTTPTTCAIILR